jgi:flavin reductase (NADH)
VALVDDFKQALGSWASGVTIVSARDGDLMYALTVSSFASVSLDPPLVVVCIGTQNRLCGMVTRSGRFGVSILSRGQESHSNHFASRDRVPTGDLIEAMGGQTTHGLPVIAGASATLECSLHQAIPMGDHLMLMGEVTEATADGEEWPLLYFRRAYRGVTGD